MLAPSARGTMHLVVELHGAHPGNIYEIWLGELEPAGGACQDAHHIDSIMADDFGEASATAESGGWTPGEHTFQILLIPTDIGRYETDTGYVTDPQTFTIQ